MSYCIFFEKVCVEFLLSTVFTRHLSKLENLQLNGNRLHSLPTTLSCLESLKQLNLSNNRFFTIPRAILYLYNLQVLDLSANRITEIKDEIELLEVDELNLNHNQVSVLLGFVTHRYTFTFSSSSSRFLKFLLIYQNANDWKFFD